MPILKESKKSKKRHRENPEESSVCAVSEEYDECKDLRLLIEALDAEKKRDSFVYQQPAPPKPVDAKKSNKGPHHAGPFITGEFCTETAAISNYRRQ